MAKCKLYSTQVQRLSLNYAVFDFHFSPRDPALFAVALGTVAVSLYRIRDASHSSTPAIEFVRTIPVHDDPSQLTLYLAWIPPLEEGQNGDSGCDSETDGFAVSFSGGQVSVFHTNCTPSHELTRDTMSEIQFPASPPIEVWYLAFSPSRATENQLPSLFSGDDFAQVREFVFPLQSNSEDENEDENDTTLAPYQKSHDRGRHHGAGVTAILPLFGDDLGTVLLTGSYDGCVRVYRLGARGIVLAEMDLGGGVWRLKLIQTTGADTMPSDSVREGGQRYYVLASCMHAGARVVEVLHTARRRDRDDECDSWSFRVLAEFTEHTSMNYASDFWASRNGEGGAAELFYVSSSFYDRRVCVWRPSIRTY